VFSPFAGRFGHKTDTLWGNRMPLAVLVAQVSDTAAVLLSNPKRTRIIFSRAWATESSVSVESRSTCCFQRQTSYIEQIVWAQESRYQSLGHNVGCNVFNVRMTLHCGIPHPSFTRKLNYSCWKNHSSEIMRVYFVRVVESKCVCMCVTVWTNHMHDCILREMPFLTQEIKFACMHRSQGYHNFGLPFHIRAARQACTVVHSILYCGPCDEH
jgi:hypothetical protein